MEHEFTAVHRIEFADTDSAGLVHFAAYFRLMEETEHAFYRSLGGSAFERVPGGGRGMPRVSASCEYLLPVRFEDEVEVRLVVREKGARRMRYDFEFRVLPGSAPAARGTMTVVNAMQSADGSYASAPLPGFLRYGAQAAPDDPSSS